MIPQARLWARFRVRLLWPRLRGSTWSPEAHAWVVGLEAHAASQSLSAAKP